LQYLYERTNLSITVMKYRSFRRLIVERIPEPTTTPGGIHLPEISYQAKNTARGKVLDGYLFQSQENRAPNETIKPGDQIIFSLSAPSDGRVYFVEESNVYAILDVD